MRWSFPLGRVRGIRIGVHASFFLIILWAGWLGGRYAGMPGAAWAIAMMALLFVCVVLHELGHSLVAMRCGVRVRHITLLPIGGVAAMDTIPEDPRQELAIAIAGPLVNVGILAVLLPWRGFPAWLNIPLIPQSMPQLVDAVVRANIVLVFFNLLPAFPMDGGRVLRAVLAMVFRYTTATAWAATLGRVVAIGFMGLGLLAANPFLVLIGFFVFFGAGAEHRLVRFKYGLKGRVARTEMQPVPPILPPETPLGTCAAICQTDGHRDFLVGWSPAQVFGMLPYRHWAAAIKRYGPEARVGQHTRPYFIHLPADAPLEALAPQLQASKQPFYPVRCDGRICGIVYRRDLERRR